MENYEKKYKEALERAEKLQETCDSQAVIGWCEFIFPELKESEDERIRKELIQFIKKRDRSGCDYDYDQWIAWLEKQGEKDKLIQELGKYKIKYTQEVLEKHINSMSNKNDERLRKTTIDFLKEFADKGYENAVECIDWLEKQDDQKLVNFTKTCKDEDTLLSLLQQMPSCITVDGIDYHFVMKKTIAYMVFYESEDEGDMKVIFWMAGDPIDICKEMLKRLEKEELI